MALQEYNAAEVCNALHNAAGNVKLAAQILDCSPATVYRYAKRYSTVDKAMHDSRINAYAEAEGALIGMIRDSTHRDHYRAVTKALDTYSPLVDDGVDYTDRGTSGDAIATVAVQVNYPTDVPPPDSLRENR